MIDQNIKNMKNIQLNVQNTIDDIQSNFLWKWILQYTLIIVSFLFIYPSLLQSNINIHDSLVLFTKISLRDVDYYLQHYKKIYFYLNNIENTSILAREIDKFISIQKAIQIKNKKNQDSRSVNRARLYKGVRINRGEFFVRIFAFVLFFMAFLSLKDYKVMIFVNQMNEMQVYHVEQHNLINNHTVYSLFYHNFLKDFADFKTGFEMEKSYVQFMEFKQNKVVEILM